MRLLLTLVVLAASNSNHKRPADMDVLRAVLRASVENPAVRAMREPAPFPLPICLSLTRLTVKEALVPGARPMWKKKPVPTPADVARQLSTSWVAVYRRQDCTQDEHGTLVPPGGIRWDKCQKDKEGRLLCFAAVPVSVSLPLWTGPDTAIVEVTSGQNLSGGTDECSVKVDETGEPHVSCVAVGQS